MEEIFNGNVYVFSAYTIDNKNKLNRSSKLGDEEVNHYLECFKNTIKEEVGLNSINSLKRIFLEEVEILYLDNKETKTIKTLKVNLVLTYDSISNISMITIMFLNIKMPISQLLDRMSQNFFEIKIEDKIVELNKYLKEKYSLKSLKFSKACLSSNNEIDEEFYPYYMANETYDSQLMCAQLKRNLYGKDSLKNIAQYESSDIYSGKNTVIRIDKRKYNSDKNSIDRIKSDIIFLFILEILMFKESSIEKTNKKVISYLSAEKDTDLSKLDEINQEFSQAIHFWDINIFNYIAAQNLANNIEKLFNIEYKINSFKENQTNLEHKINIKQALTQEKQNDILFLIALILFIFEINNIMKDFIGKTDSLSISASLIITILIIIKVAKKKIL